MANPMTSHLTIENLHTKLHRHFGFKRFRAGQAEAVEASLAGRDVLAVMPTGSGKSLCYQLSALESAGITVVVSPLISLMKDRPIACATKALPSPR